MMHISRIIDNDKKKFQMNEILKLIIVKQIKQTQKLFTDQNYFKYSQIYSKSKGYL